MRISEEKTCQEKVLNETERTNERKLLRLIEGGEESSKRDLRNFLD
jgi:hypothetical protein